MIYRNWQFESCQDSKSHLFAMIICMGFIQCSESVVHGMGRGQTCALESYTA